MVTEAVFNPLTGAPIVSILKTLFGSEGGEGGAFGDGVASLAIVEFRFFWIVGTSFPSRKSWTTCLARAALREQFGSLTRHSAMVMPQLQLHRLSFSNFVTVATCSGERPCTSIHVKLPLASGGAASGAGEKDAGSAVGAGGFPCCTLTSMAAPNPPTTRVRRSATRNLFIENVLRTGCEESA